MTSRPCPIIYIPIWTIKDRQLIPAPVRVNNIYIPIWTIKDRLRNSYSDGRFDIYIPIWTIKDKKLHCKSS